jgi:hypothetical protein
MAESMTIDQRNATISPGGDLLAKLNHIDMHGKIEISNRPYTVHMGEKTEVWGAEIERASDGKTLYATDEDFGVLLDSCIEWIRDGHSQ